jgi:hypothetical protein
MKNHVFRIGAIAFLLLFQLAACKKDDQQAEDGQLDEQSRQHNDDSNLFLSESDQSDNDINAVLKDIPAFGRVAGTDVIPVCGMTVDSSQVAQHILTLLFDSATVCPNPDRLRSGQIRVELTSGAYWRDPGAVLTVTYLHYGVTRVSDGRFVILNGTKTLTNVNGNNWTGFLAGTDTLLYRSRALGVSAQFSGGNSATWNLARTTSWWYAPLTQKITFSADGDTTISGYPRTGSWGVNRFGYTFNTYYNQALEANSSCGFYRPVRGTLTHHVRLSNFILTFGVDQDGNWLGGACAYGYKVAWTIGNGTLVTAVFSY